MWLCRFSAWSSRYVHISLLKQHTLFFRCVQIIGNISTKEQGQSSELHVFVATGQRNFATWKANTKSPRYADLARSSEFMLQYRYTSQGAQKKNNSSNNVCETCWRALDGFSDCLLSQFITTTIGRVIVALFCVMFTVHHHMCSACHRWVVKAVKLRIRDAGTS